MSHLWIQQYFCFLLLRKPVFNIAVFSMLCVHDACSSPSSVQRIAQSNFFLFCQRQLWWRDHFVMSFIFHGNVKEQSQLFVKGDFHSPRCTWLLDSSVIKCQSTISHITTGHVCMKQIRWYSVCPTKCKVSTAYIVIVLNDLTINYCYWHY